ncbi:MAG: hypothetical protein OXC68_08960, partial [Aestuariivita sp.]|nr:hypothetical protein [Aestuariivita sp.]
MQLVGDTASLWPLTVVVTAYLSRLAMHVANATRNKVASFVKRKDAAPLVGLVYRIIKSLTYCWPCYRRSLSSGTAPVPDSSHPIFNISLKKINSINELKK